MISLVKLYCQVLTPHANGAEVPDREHTPCEQSRSVRVDGEAKTQLARETTAQIDGDGHIGADRSSDLLGRCTSIDKRWK